MAPSFELTAPDHFTAGTLGRPGEREFYLQSREAGVVVTLKVEKDQVGALGEYLASLLTRLGETLAEDQEGVELVEPIQPAWAVGTLGVGYDETEDRIVVVATELREVEEDEAEAEGGVPAAMEAATEEVAEAATASFRITRAQAAAFVARAQALIKAGRPVCPFCSRPMEPEGHVCPRLNGHVTRG